MTIRPYDPQRDGDAVSRIWREIGWAENEEDEEAARTFLQAGLTLVAEQNGRPEALAASVTGAMAYVDRDLPLAIVSAVGTGLVARKQGLASRLTAELVARQAAGGAAVAALGIFEQGFYDQVGFGTLPYLHSVRFDPARLQLPIRARPPRRLDQSDATALFRAHQQSYRGHGGCRIDAPEFVAAELKWARDGFGLGYDDGEDGEISHALWLTGKREHGPYRVHFLVYRTPHQYLELLALLRTLGDQVGVVTVREPAWIQLQDLLHQPFRRQMIGRKGEFETGVRAFAYQQARILDLPTCVSRLHLEGPEIRFNLALTDPITRWLGPKAPWTGLEGTYRVTLGQPSAVHPGMEADLPTLQATVGGFSRLWLGVRPATGLAATGSLSGPKELLTALDQAIRLPVPDPGLDF